MKARAPGKLILLGEYAVLRGHPALVAAVDRHAVVTVRPSNEMRVVAPELGIDCRAPTMRELAQHDARLTLTAAVWRHVIDEAETHRPVQLEIETSQFFKGDSKLGLGSSAAVAVALARALRMAAAREELSSEESFSVAYSAHREAQGGVGSGVDIAASAFGGTLVYERPSGGETEPALVRWATWPRELSAAWVFTGQSTSTPSFIEAIRALEHRDQALAERSFEALAAVTRRGINAFERSENRAFLEAVSEFERALDALGQRAKLPIISERHAQMRALASEFGASYKPSGAGGGDIGVAFFDDADARRAFCKRTSAVELALTPASPPSF